VQASMTRWAREPGYLTKDLEPLSPAYQPQVDGKTVSGASVPNEVVDTHEQMEDVPSATLLIERNESRLGAMEEQELTVAVEPLRVVEIEEQVDLNLSIDSTLLVEEERVPKRVASISSEGEPEDGSGRPERRRRSDKKKRRKADRESDRAKLDAMQKAIEGMVEKVAKLQVPAVVAPVVQRAVEGMVERVDKPQAPSGVAPVVQEEDTRKAETRMKPSLHAISKTVARVSGLVTHSRGSKTDWAISLAQEVQVLVIGDSNLRDVVSVPPWWEVHVFPGARMGHVIGACSLLLSAKPRDLKVVFIQIGVNHREDTSLPIQHMKILVRNLRASGVQAAFVGVSYDSQLPGRQRIQLDELNQAAKDEFDHYVPSLHPRHVTIRQGDKYGIHHDRDTVGRVMTSMVESYLSILE